MHDVGRARSALFICVLALSLFRCAGTVAQTSAGGAGSVPGSGFAGVWKSDGYGVVLVLAGDALKLFEVTNTSCVASISAARVRGPAQQVGLEAAFRIGSTVLELRAGQDAQTRRLHVAGAASDVLLQRLTTLPALCSTPTPNTPQGNFEVFAQTWAEHYIMFDAKHMDWSAVVTRARAQVTPSTSPAELFDIFVGMIAPFEDAHSSINAPELGKQFGALRAGTGRLMPNGMDEFVEKTLPAVLAVTDRQMQAPLARFCEGRVQYGHVDASTGYLRILAESGYTASADFAEGMEALQNALDAIFSDPELRRLIVDVRINFGGSDPYGLALASRLAATTFTAYAKQARNDPLDRTRWTAAQPSVVQPSLRPSFHGPVIMLTGPLTISAGETMTQALMNRTPRILRIGEHTQGVYSDPLMRALPNGWSFGLPNEVFRTQQGTTFDGIGIAPDIAVPVFADADLAAGLDPGLARAMVELARP